MIYIFIFSFILNSREFDNNKIPEPNYSFNSNQKWWSNDFFGNTHKKIAKKAFESISKEEYPDIFFYKNEIVKYASDEDGHPDITHNGGDVFAIWNKILDKYGDGDVIRRKIGVLYHWKNLNFKEAYQNIGIIVHLTQDQAVPLHAANIDHSIFDSFESFYYEYDNNIDLSIIKNFIPQNLKPWEYYQFLQDDTRKNLKKWIDPETGIPYWEESKDAPPLGKDTTYGPKGRYGGGKDHFTKIVCEDNTENSSCSSVPKSPEIRQRQLAVSVYATEAVLKSASRNLPPLISNIKKGPERISFDIYENRCKTVDYLLKKDNQIIEQKTINLNLNQIPYSRNLSIIIEEKGSYIIKIIDCDNNFAIHNLKID